MGLNYTFFYLFFLNLIYASEIEKQDKLEPYFLHFNTSIVENMPCQIDVLQMLLKPAHNLVTAESIYTRPYKYTVKSAANT